MDGSGPVCYATSSLVNSHYDERGYAESVSTALPSYFVVPFAQLFFEKYGPLYNNPNMSAVTTELNSTSLRFVIGLPGGLASEMGIEIAIAATSANLTAVPGGKILDFLCVCCLLQSDLQITAILF